MLDSARAAGEARGETVVFVAVDGVACAAVAIADTVKDSAAEAVAPCTVADCRRCCSPATTRRGRRGCRPGRHRGRHRRCAARRQSRRDPAAAQGGQARRDGRRRHQRRPRVGTADLGLAIGRGTDVAIGAADIILVRDDLDIVPQALDLARATMRTIR